MLTRPAKTHAWIALLFVFGACVHQASNSSSTIQGAYSDIKMQAGHYHGYDVLRSCRSGMIVVHGQGSHPPASLPTLVSALYDAHLVPSVTMASDGPGCEAAERAAYLYLSDFREIDIAVERIGAYLTAHDLNAWVVIAMSAGLTLD
jgi:hypothetical protein